jgi:hypothetical protein
VATAESSAGRRERWRSRLFLVLFAVSAGICVQVLVLYTMSGGAPVDAFSYWQTDPSNPYPLDRTEYQFGYSPVIAQLWAPLFQLPLDVFVFIFRAVEVAGLVLLAGPLAGLFIFTSPVASEVNAGNINFALGVIMVLGFRWPALWAIPLLTKPSMGVGLVWFVVRREWRKALIPVAIAGALAAVSFAFAPNLWFEWVRWIQVGTSPVGLWPYPWPIWARLPISLALVIWGARTNRPWTVVVASAFALPRLYFQSPAILVAVIPLIPSVGRTLVPWMRRLGRLDALLPAGKPRWRKASIPDEQRPAGELAPL